MFNGSDAYNEALVPRRACVSLRCGFGASVHVNLSILAYLFDAVSKVEASNAVFLVHNSGID